MRIKLIFQYSVPKYLFKEKNRFISIFEKINNKKKSKLVELIYRTESLIRKEKGLSVVIGLKFLLSLRKNCYFLSLFIISSSWFKSE